jgi:hypothetical protein
MGLEGTSICDSTSELNRRRKLPQGQEQVARCPTLRGKAISVRD